MPRSDLKITSWNMGGFACQKKQVEAWAYLENNLKPDVALLQEVRRSKFEEWRECRQGFAFQGAAFGTMIFCGHDFAGKVIANDDLCCRQSDMYVSAVDVRLTANPIAILSIHVYPGEQQKKILRKLLGFLEQALLLKPTIVGGDFNACRHYDVIYRKNAYSWFFKEMELIGFYDCHFGLHGEERRTYWSRKTDKPYQDDHIFVPMHWKDRVVSCDVLPYDPARGLSDHGPIELVIDLPK